MRFSMVLLAISFSASGARAASYNEELGRLQARDRKIDWGLAELGLPGTSTARPADQEDESKVPAGRILRVVSSGSELRAQAGKLLFGKLTTRLLVGPEPTPVVITLADGQGLFSGLRALGKAHQSSVYGRIQIDFDRIVARGGKVIAVRAAGLDGAGAYGLEAEVFSSKALAVVGAMASSFVAGLAASQQTQATSVLGFSQVQPTGRNAVLQGVAQTAADQSKRLIDEATQERPVLLIEPGAKVTIYLDDEVRF